MAINFRWPQFLKSIRFGSTLAWGEFSSQGIIKTLTGSLPLLLSNTIKQPIKSLVQYGKCEQDDTPTPSNPVDIVCNNGAVKWGASGTNLLDMAEGNIRLRYYINDSGVETSNNQNFYNTKFIPVKPNTAYTLSTSEPVYYTFIMEYDSNKDFLQRTLDGDASDKHSSMTITTKADTAYILIGSNPIRATMYVEDVISINWMLNEGSTALPYEPYTEGIVIDGTPEVLSVETQTASVQNLFAVGDYADAQDIISGAITRQIGMKVLDGTEADWLASSMGGIWMLRLWGKAGTSAMALTSTHFTGTNAVNESMPDNSIMFNNSTVFIKATAYSTLDDFKAYLAAQYAQGTPVIVLYPLTEETTETVTGQILKTEEGTTSISATAEIAPIDVEIKYSALDE